MSTSPTASGPPTELELSDAYFAVGQCAGPVIGKSKGGSGAPYQPVDCGDVFAVAKVTKRGAAAAPGATAGVPATAATVGTDCEDTTDLVLDLGRNLAQATGTETAGDGRGAYACLRNLKPPHPSDPGMGGGPRIIVGDCVYQAKVLGGANVTRETACDTTGTHRPEHRVVKVYVPNFAKGGPQESCPEGTVQLSLSTTGRIDLFGPVACGEKL
ncbi:hypothetical protein ACFCX4_33250 [Kitasatospora sp. NPDC056327]|uniref:hypothetical protein n=1 Tax=Kitasatospora sp. NPDC056327 TaxID=3345785 RepID=UPI0035DFB2E6